MSYEISITEGGARAPLITLHVDSFAVDAGEATTALRFNVDKDAAQDLDAMPLESAERERERAKTWKRIAVPLLFGVNRRFAEQHFHIEAHFDKSFDPNHILTALRDDAERMASRTPHADFHHEETPLPKPAPLGERLLSKEDIERATHEPGDPPPRSGLVLGIDQAGRTVISIYKNGDFVEKREVNRYAPNSGKWICLTCNAPRAVSAGSAWSRCTNCGDVAPGSMGHADDCRCRCCEDYRRAVAGDKEPSK